VADIYAMNVNPTEQSILNRASRDKFLLVLNLPAAIQNQAKDNGLSIEPLQISVHGSVVPTISIPKIEVPFGGQSYNVSSYTRPNYSPLKVNFIVDNKFRNWWLLWKWLTILNNPREGGYGGTLQNQSNFKEIRAAGLPEYQTTMSLFALNEYNQNIIEFIYYNAFITSLGGIEYSYRDATLVESSVEFQFSQFDVNLAT
jgi:hypothetical protein